MGLLAKGAGAQGRGLSQRYLWAQLLSGAGFSRDPLQLELKRRGGGKDCRTFRKLVGSKLRKMLLPRAPFHEKGRMTQAGAMENYHPSQDLIKERPAFVG